MASRGLAQAKAPLTLQLTPAPVPQALGMVWRGGIVDQRVEHGVAQTAWLAPGDDGGRLGSPGCPEAPPAADEVRSGPGDANLGIGRWRGFLPPWRGGLGKGWPRRRLTQQAS